MWRMKRKRYREYSHKVGGAIREDGVPGPLLKGHPEKKTFLLGGEGEDQL